MTQLTSHWLTQRQLADHLQISERTLLRWRVAGFLRSGERYRRKFPTSNSPLLYQLERCEQLMSGLFRDESAATLKQQALDLLSSGKNHLSDDALDTIRRALEQLND